jgi:hypothetical protein
MSHEARINDALRQLGDEYRLGMVQPEEYRARRRMLLDSWYERDVTTSPGSLRSANLPQRTPPTTKRVAAQVEDKNTPKLVLIGLAVAIGIAASAYLAFAPKKMPAVSPDATPMQPPPSAAVLAARKTVDEFLTLNAWEPAQIEALLEQWRTLSPADRARAREEPAVRSLRYKLDQNIQAEAQLVPPAAPPEDRLRLDLLTRFAQELDE